MHAERLTRALIRMAPLILIGVLWEAATFAGLIKTAFLPSPVMIIVALGDLLSGGEISKNLFITLFRAGTGLALGAISGVWLGLMMARSANFRAWVTPIVGGTYSLPKSALIPLFALWFGIGNITAICAVYLACLLPMIVNTFQGVISTPKVLVWSAQSLGTSERQLSTQIYLRHALPDILTGLRIALGFSC
jgi:ABC-type nitrate/sulfonate/bicarbonate transport system permease component